MKCNCCPALIDCSNEDVGHETTCWYGDSYQDENCIEYKDGSCGCNKTREEIEADMKRANDYLASEEYQAEPFPPFMQSLIAAGGLAPYMAKEAEL